MAAAKLGIVAGSGELPARLISACRAENRPFFVLALKGAADPELAKDLPHAWIRIGQGGAGMRYLRQAGVTELVLAGGVRRPSPWALWPDLRAVKFYIDIGLKALGDDGLLRALIHTLEDEGFRVVGAESILKSALAPLGPLGRIAPDQESAADIALGIMEARKLGARDLGQAVVVRQGAVLASEDVSGTDALISRAKSLKRPGRGGVLVKTAKPGQERRADLPAIGPNTVAEAAAAGLSGIAIEAGATLLIDRPAIAAAADRAGIFVVGVEVSDAASGANASPLIYLIAGEPSGDALGANLMRALREKTGGLVRFAGIGSEQMAAQGLSSLMPIGELAIMGVAEVLPRALKILRLVDRTVADIRRLGPDAVVTIDSSGFNWRVAQRLRRAGQTLPLIHYVAPMVWAWRAGRARRMARWYDHLMALLPFEPPYFEAVGLSCSYVGHPVVEMGADQGDGAAFRKRHGIAPNATLIAVLPGSRRGEVKRLLPIFSDAVALLIARYPNLALVVPTTGNVADEVASGVAHWKVKPILLRGPAERFDAFAACNAALAASGTVALELALAKAPTVVAYRVNTLTHFLVKRIVKIEYAHLLNLILKRHAVPELLQENCTPEKLSDAISRLIDDPEARRDQLAACQEGLKAIGYGGVSPGQRAAAEVLARMKSRTRIA
jgi:lipid-A-disaccharide synthase